jgi:hypothetical protein
MSENINKITSVDANKPGKQKKKAWKNKNKNKNKSESQEVDSDKVKENVNVNNGAIKDKKHSQVSKRKFGVNRNTAGENSAHRPEKNGNRTNDISYAAHSFSFRPLPHMFPLTSADHEKSSEFHLHMAELYGLQRDSFLDTELQKIYIVSNTLLENDSKNICISDDI